MKKAMKKIITLCIGASLMMGLTACSGSANDTNNSTGSKTNLILGCSNFSDTLDPSASPNSAWGTARYGIGESLFQFDASMNAVYQLCDTYEVDDTKTIWEFHIRDGVNFSNGVPLTATKVQDSFEYLYKQEATGAGTNTPSQYMALDHIEADDDTNVVTIITAKPYADLPKILSHVNFIVLDTDSDLATYPIGTGPYVVTNNQVGVSMSLERNEMYWNGEVPFETFDILYMEDSTTKALALQAGDVDIVDSITTSHDLATLKNASNFDVAETLSARTAFSYVNYDGVLGNEILREAILLAVDDDTICDITVGGIYSSGYSILPPTLDYGHEKLTDKTPYNLEQAKKILDEANIVDTDGDGIRELDGENISLEYVSYVLKSLDSVSEGVTMNLKELGIDVDLKVLNSDTHWNMVVNGAFDLAICSWITTPVGDPIGFLENWYSKGNLNYGNYYSAEYDKLYEALVLELDLQKQKDIIERLQQILIDDCAIMVHGYYKSNLSSNTKITGVEMPISETYWITTAIKPV